MESIDKVKGTFGRGPASRMQKEDEVPLAIIRRLPRYHRFLGELLRAGTLRISSAELSRLMGVTASQIRADFNRFGGFGQQGYGYNVKYLHSKLGELLGITEDYRAVIVGAGNLGRALATSHMFKRRGVTPVALFDNDNSVIGQSIGGIPVLDVATLPEYLKSEKIDIGVLTVPKDSARDVCDTLAKGGVLGIWNFASSELDGIHGVVIENVHLGDSLLQLTYAMRTGAGGDGTDE